MSSLTGLFDEEAANLSAPDEDIVRPFDPGRLARSFLHELTDGDAREGRQHDGPGDRRRRHHQEREEDAGLRRGGPRSAVLSPPEGLFIREQGETIEVGPIDEPESLRVGAVDASEDEDTSTETGRREVPFFVKLGVGAEEGTRVEQGMEPLAGRQLNHG